MKTGTFELGARWESIDGDDVYDAAHKALREHAAVRQYQEYAGVKHFRMRPLVGTAVGGALTMGGPHHGPMSGFVWSIRRIFITGLAAGAVPDVVNFYLNDTGTQPIWQMNGNNPGQTFGRLELTMYGGDGLFVANSGTFNSTSQIVITGEAVEVPQQKIAKLA
jgi:hypothetical protein